MNSRRGDGLFMVSAWLNEPAAEGDVRAVFAYASSCPGAGWIESYFAIAGE